jgi:hypothetical protein
MVDVIMVFSLAVGFGLIFLFANWVEKQVGKK